ncbi:BQ5605_C039g11820 [Microbotryum silenes-dioicae]|uniref:BQ5605_C039g11820 protein n=1 Tax=Microbotryum silenes-dioicae TaxID=796604 RepID=A0A2X0N1H0_9BASI|nr:BQ5605_C039g11820 [Microbotryum silenes-dioicae]
MAGDRSLDDAFDRLRCERPFSAGRRTINQLQHATSRSLLNAKMCVGSWADAVADDDAARKELIDRVTVIFTPIVRLSYSAQPPKVVPGNRRATGTRETITSMMMMCRSVM